MKVQGAFLYTSGRMNVNHATSPEAERPSIQHTHIHTQIECGEWKDVKNFSSHFLTVNHTIARRSKLADVCVRCRGSNEKKCQESHLWLSVDSKSRQMKESRKREREERGEIEKQDTKSSEQGEMLQARLSQPNGHKWFYDRWMKIACIK